MGTLTLYPKVIVKGQSFVGCKVITVPDQSLSLAEIIRRFTRKEALPIEKEGTYETRFGDLEKIRDSDLTEQAEHIEHIKEAHKTYVKRVKKKADEEALKKEAPPKSMEV